MLFSVAQAFVGRDEKQAPLEICPSLHVAAKIAGQIIEFAKLTKF